MRFTCLRCQKQLLELVFPSQQAGNGERLKLNIAMELLHFATTPLFLDYRVGVSAAVSNWWQILVMLMNFMTSLPSDSAQR